jgi:hypothetical protein
MSTRLIWSLGSAGVVLVAWAVVLAIGFYGWRRPHKRERAAQRFAEHLNLALPPEYTDRLARRLRRRGAVTVVIIGPFFAAWSAWYLYYYLLLPRSEFQPHAGLPGMVPVMPIWALLGLAIAAGHLYDSIRDSRETGTRVARIGQPRLTDAVPPILVWPVRVTGALPLLAAFAWLLAPISIQHGKDAAHPHPIWFAIAAITAPLAVVATEAVQKRILHSLQHATMAQELAFDDALRVQAMLALLIVPAVVCTAAATLIAAPLGYARDWSGSLPVFTAITLATFPLIGLNGVSNAKWARRHFLGRRARFSGQAPPAATDLVVGEV